MHCPRCGQEQASAETRFCSRCGFQLDLVSELLVHGGVLPQYVHPDEKGSTLFTRRNGLIFTLIWFISFLFILTPISAILDLDPIVPVFGVLSIFGSLLLLMISLLVLPSGNKAQAKQFAAPARFDPNMQRGEMSGRQDHSALPPSRTEPAAVYTAPQAGGWKAPDTGEFAVPSSVTENTTKLLKKEEES